MTNAQKDRIATMRGNGESYADIAAELGLSENTVKSYGRRNKLSNNAEQKNCDGTGKIACAHCGKTIGISSQKTKRFCSDRCRMAWWKAHPELLNHKVIYHFSCVCCGAPFVSHSSSHRKYCSRACYAKAKTIVTRTRYAQTQPHKIKIQPPQTKIRPMEACS